MNPKSALVTGGLKTLAPAGIKVRYLDKGLIPLLLKWYQSLKARVE